MISTVLKNVMLGGLVVATHRLVPQTVRLLINRSLGTILWHMEMIPVWIRMGSFVIVLHKLMDLCKFDKLPAVGRMVLLKLVRVGCHRNIRRLRNVLAGSPQGECTVKSQELRSFHHVFTFISPHQSKSWVNFFGLLHPNFTINSLAFHYHFCTTYYHVNYYQVNLHQECSMNFCLTNDNMEYCR
jgi:hypothetical protein